MRSSRPAAGEWGAFFCSRRSVSAGGELLFGFFGEVPGGWLQREEKKLVLAGERKVRET